MSDDLTTAIIDALTPSLRRFVHAEVQRAEWTWRWRTVEQTAELLGISPAAVRTRVTRGMLTATKFDGRLYFDITDLDLAIRGEC